MAASSSARTLPPPEVCHRALADRDPNFDGRFVAAITSTKIYCRPSCPAPAAKPENVRFLPSPAAAREAGFRACKRCDPDDVE